MDTFGDSMGKAGAFLSKQDLKEQKDIDDIKRENAAKKERLSIQRKQREQQAKNEPDGQMPKSNPDEHIPVPPEPEHVPPETKKAPCPPKPETKADATGPKQSPKPQTIDPKQTRGNQEEICLKEFAMMTRDLSAQCQKKFEAALTQGIKGSVKAYFKYICITVIIFFIALISAYYAGRYSEKDENVTFQNQVFNNAIKASLVNYIRHYYSVTPDSKVQQQNIDYVFSYLVASDYVTNQATLYFQDIRNSPSARSQREKVEVEIKSTIKESEYNWQVVWDEKTYDLRNNPVRKTRRHVTHFEITVVDVPREEKDIYNNPVGILIKKMQDNFVEEVPEKK